MGFGSDGMDGPLVGDGAGQPDGPVAGPLDEGALADVAEHGTSEIPVYTFTSFGELKAAVDADPPTHDALGLYNYVQGELQRPSNLVTQTVDELWQSGNLRGILEEPLSREDVDIMAAEAHVEFAWLKGALVQLEERAFGPIRREPRTTP